MEQDFLLRPARTEDAKAVWEIRNDPGARAASGNSEEISFEDHLAWFKNQYFEKGASRCFIWEQKEKPVGYCRFDEVEKGFRVSIALAKVYQGMGLGGILLGEGLKKMGVGNFFAIIKKNNTPSLEVFEANGFLRTDQDGDFFYFQLTK